MKCNWCGKGEGRNYTKNREGDIYYYYCQDCLTDYTNELPFIRGDEKE